jgi:hypothetical protein
MSSEILGTRFPGDRGGLDEGDIDASKVIEVRLRAGRAIRLFGQLIIISAKFWIYSAACGVGSTAKLPSSVKA